MPVKPSLTKLLKKKFADTLQVNVPLHQKSYLNLGGTAAYFLRFSDPNAVAEAVTFLHEHDIAYFILGRGTNTLIREGSIQPVIIEFAKTRSVVVDPTTHEITYPAGTLLIQAIKLALNHSLGGMEFAIGIPGSIGGAVKMNAGTHLGEVKNVLKTARILRKTERLLKVSVETPASLDLRYRHSNILTGEVVLSACFALQPLPAGEVAKAKHFVLEQLARRKQTQPLGLPSLGSTFKNPPPIDGQPQYAAKLIEAAGLKGMRVGGIEVSSSHANFIINTGAGTSDDAYALLELITETVYKKFNIHLEREIMLLGW